MVVCLIVFVYLWAGEEFTHYLYPGPGVAESYFVAAAFNPHVFDAIIVISTVFILSGWFAVYTNTKGQKIFITRWIISIRKQMYILLINRFYVDLIYVRWSHKILRLAQKVAHRF